jgi:hypothetical protein
MCLNDVLGAANDPASKLFQFWPSDTCGPSAATPSDKQGDQKQKLNEAINKEKYDETPIKEIANSLGMPDLPTLTDADVNAGSNARVEVVPDDEYKRENKGTGCEGAPACSDGKSIEIPASTLKNEDPDYVARILDHERAHIALQHAAERAGEGRVDHKSAHHFINTVLGWGPREKLKWDCGPESESCLGCSPGGALAKAAFECIVPPGTEGGGGPPPAPGGGVVDPSPLDAPQRVGPDCFEEPREGGSSMACAAVDCGIDTNPVVVDGKCSCGPPPGTGPPPRKDCAFIDCGPDAHPVAGPEGCRCAGAGLGPGGIGPIGGDPRFRNGEVFRSPRAAGPPR